MTVAGLLRELIRIPSVNPDGNPGIDAPGEGRCAAFLEAFLAGLGAEATLEEVLPDRPNVVARFPADRPGKPRLLLAPHTDTVSVAGMTIDPFGGEVRSGRIWGRGASDTKGPMAAMLAALHECREILAGLSHEIWFAGLMGEEASQHGAKALAAARRFDFVIAAEPTKLRTVHAHKGSAGITLRTHGRAVHASAPELGENAIYNMVETVSRLRSCWESEQRPFADDILGPPTLSVNTITGGSKVNIVPDSCEARVDIRTVPGQDLEGFLKMVRSELPALDVECSLSPPLHTDPGHPLIAQLEACGAGRTTAAWFCDAAVFAAAGVPSVALGPGSMTQAHTADEWIAVDDLEAGVAFFKKFFHSLAV